MTVAFQRDTSSFVSLLSYTSVLYAFLANQIGLIAGGLLADIFAFNEETLPESHLHQADDTSEEPKSSHPTLYIGTVLIFLTILAVAIFKYC